MSLSGDTLRDLKLNQDRQIHLGGDGDLAVTDGIETVQQSVAINAGDVLRPLIGEPLEGSSYEEITGELEAVLSRDPQIDSVHRVEVSEVNRTDGTVSVRVFTSYNNSFDLDIIVSNGET